MAVEQAGAAAAQLVADFKIGAPARYPILIISYELYRCCEMKISWRSAHSCNGSHDAIA